MSNIRKNFVIGFFKILSLILVLNSTKRVYSVFDREAFDHGCIEVLRAIKSVQTAAISPIEDPRSYLGLFASEQAKNGIIGSLEDLLESWIRFTNKIHIQSEKLTPLEKQFILECFDELFMEFDKLIGLPCVPSHGKIYKGLLQRTGVIDVLHGQEGYYGKKFQDNLVNAYISLIINGALTTATLGDIDRTIKISKIMPIFVLDLEYWFNTHLGMKSDSLDLVEKQFKVLAEAYTHISEKLAEDGHKNQSNIFLEKALITGSVLPALLVARRAIIKSEPDTAKKALFEAQEILRFSGSRFREMIDFLTSNDSRTKKERIERAVLDNIEDLSARESAREKIARVLDSPDVEQLNIEILTNKIICSERAIEKLREFSGKIDGLETINNLIREQLIVLDTYNL